MGNTKNISIQSFGWNGKSSGQKVFKKLSDKFKDSEIFQSCSEDFKEYVKTADALTNSGIQEQLMEDMLTSQGESINEFYHVEPLLADAMHFSTAYRYGISSAIAKKNHEAINNYEESFGEFLVMHTTDKKLDKILSSAKDIGFDNVILELYKRKEGGKAGIIYDSGWQGDTNE